MIIEVEDRFCKAAKVFSKVLEQAPTCGRTGRCGA